MPSIIYHLRLYANENLACFASSHCLRLYITICGHTDSQDAVNENPITLSGFYWQDIRWALPWPAKFEGMYLADTMFVLQGLGLFCKVETFYLDSCISCEQRELSYVFCMLSVYFQIISYVAVISLCGSFYLGCNKNAVFSYSWC